MNTQMMGPKSNTPPSPMEVEHHVDENVKLTWAYAQANFKPSDTDLLSEHVDPAEEAHMELKPDDSKTLALKHHKRVNSNATDVTEQITDFGFLSDEFFNDAANEYDDNLMTDFAKRNESVVRVLFS